MKVLLRNWIFIPDNLETIGDEFTLSIHIASKRWADIGYEFFGMIKEYVLLIAVTEVELLLFQTIVEIK